MAIYDQYGEDYFVMRSYDQLRRYQAYQQEHSRLQERIQGGRVLDIGCGTGEFTAMFDARRWDVWGYDVDEYAIRQAELRGVRIVDNIDYYRLKFLYPCDLVVMRGVLQHFDNPFEMLRLAADLPRPGGMLAILAQPDADSLCYRLFHELPALDPPRNWWTPGRFELTNILVKLGFGEIEVLKPYWGGPYARPWHDFGSFVLRLFGVRRHFAFPGNMIEVYARKAHD